jgi:hypothetical protein
MVEAADKDGLAAQASILHWWALTLPLADATAHASFVAYVPNATSSGTPDAAPASDARPELPPDWTGEVPTRPRLHGAIIHDALRFDAAYRASPEAYMDALEAQQREAVAKLTKLEDRYESAKSEWMDDLNTANEAMGTKHRNRSNWQNVRAEAAEAKVVALESELAANKFSEAPEQL